MKLKIKPKKKKVEHSGGGGESWPSSGSSPHYLKAMQLLKFQNFNIVLLSSVGGGS